MSRRGAFGYGSCPRLPQTVPLPTGAAFSTPLVGDVAVIACHFNPAGFVQPVANLMRWLDWTASLALPLFMTELAYDDAPFRLPDCDRVVQLRARDEGRLFQKEALLNVVEQIVPERFTKIVMIDADVILPARGWLGRVSAALDSSRIMQPFSHCAWLDKHGTRIEREKVSAGFAWLTGRDASNVRDYHPGFAYGVRRDFFRWPVGGMPTCPIVGGGDVAMMLGAIGHTGPHFYFKDSTPEMAAHAAAYVARLAEWSGGSLDCIPGEAYHLWHGSGVRRFYQSRYDLVCEHGFDPAADLMTRADGLTVWSARARSAKPELVAAVRDYFLQRREDD